MAFTPVMGHSGSVTAGATALQTVEWVMTKRNRLAEITHSGTSGWAKRIKTVSEATFNVTAVWDSASSSQPESYTLDAGDEVNGTFKVGNSALNYTSVPLIIETLEISVNNQNNAVMYKFTAFSNGVVPDPA